MNSKILTSSKSSVNECDAAQNVGKYFFKAHGVT